MQYEVMFTQTPTCDVPWLNWLSKWWLMTKQCLSLICANEKNLIRGSSRDHLGIEHRRVFVQQSILNMCLIVFVWLRSWSFCCFESKMELRFLTCWTNDHFIETYSHVQRETRFSRVRIFKMFENPAFQRFESMIRCRCLWRFRKNDTRKS